MDYDNGNALPTLVLLALLVSLSDLVRHGTMLHCWLLFTSLRISYQLVVLTKKIKNIFYNIIIIIHYYYCVLIMRDDDEMSLLFYSDVFVSSVSVLSSISCEVLR